VKDNKGTREVCDSCRGGFRLDQQTNQCISYDSISAYDTEFKHKELNYIVNENEGLLPKNKEDLELLKELEENDQLYFI